MTENKEDDDNMIVLVIGDEEHSKDDQHIQVPCPITIKIEPLDDSIDKTAYEEIFKTFAHTDEEHTKEEYDAEYLDEDNIKEEPEEKEEYDVEYLEDYPLENEVGEEDNDDEDYSEHKTTRSKKKTIRKSRQKKTSQRKTSQRKPRNKSPVYKSPVNRTPEPPPKVVSYVKYLREKYPEMAENDQLLVEHLAGVMREMKPPEPPANYCKVIVEDGDVKYECEFCGVQRDTVPMAARHFQFKHGEFYLTCYACGLTYRNTTNLYKHEKRCAAPDGRLVLRARGHYLGRKGRGRPFTTANRFITVNTPTAKKEKFRLFCTKCPASFVHRENLVAHENSHEGVRPFRCHHCSVAYTSYPALKRHLKLHGEYQYICDHCGRKFKLKPALVSHLDSHRPVRKHGCLYCERRFTQKTALRHHTNKVHLNLPAAHGCPVCPKRYARLTHVKEHMNRAHGLTMITRKMYFQALPTMTDSEVNETKKLFNFDLNEYNESRDTDDEEEHVIPEVLLQRAKNKYVNIITRKNLNADLNQDPEYTDPDSDHAYQILKTKTKRDITKEKAALKKDQAQKQKRKLPQHKKKEATAPPVQSDEEIDGDLSSVANKRNKKAATSASEKANDEMYRMVRDIKSSLTNRKKVVNAQAERKKSNFYKLKREFMNELKNEIEIPEPEYLELGGNSPEVVPGTEIPEDLVPWTKNTENVAAQIKETTDDDATDDEEWKVHKDSTEKNKVIAEFLEYMKSGVVPKHVPILRRGSPKTVKSKPNNESGEKL